MSGLLDPTLVVLILLNFFMLGTSRIRAVIQAAAMQGVLLGLMPLMVHGQVGVHITLVAIATLAIKGLVIPNLLHRAMRNLSIQREVEPFIGLTASTVLGAVGTGLALVFARELPLNSAHTGGLLVPASLSTVFTGFLILTTRHKAITQALGYLVLENGVFIFGLLLIEALPFLVEMGVLLDLVVGIFVMGIIINHISREFDSVDTGRLSALKE
ncbi:MAG: hypothetical protein AMXMBFR13_04350 [Phycisphaerae bacterium]